MLSRSHPLARRLRALRADRGLRRSEGVIVAEGVHLAMAALDAGATIEAAVASARLSERDEGRLLLHRLERAGVGVQITTETILDALQDARSPQPVVLVVRWTPGPRERVLSAPRGAPLVVVACGVQEPGNLGALWRTADAAGATGFVATTGSASLTHPRTVRASMGSIFRLAAVELAVDEMLAEVERAELRVLGADARGAVAYEQVDWREPIALLLGQEGAGLPDEASAGIDLRVGVPMAPGVESLSVNAAAAVLLFEAARWRRVTPAG